MEGVSGGYWLYFLAQTGFVKSGSDRECLHATVGRGKHWKCMNIKKETLIFFGFCFCFCFYGCSVIRGSNWDPCRNLTFCHRVRRSYLKVKLCWESSVRERKTITFTSRSSSPFCLWLAFKYLPAVSFWVFCWVGGISVWAPRLLCAVHL